jgi:DNA-binding Lrp family transcriptional regulator
MINAVDREILIFVQDDLPLVPRPYAGLAERLGVSEDEICARLTSLSENGIIRRFGAVVRHAEAGYKANALVVWDIGDKDLDDAASILAASDAVSHLYARPTFTGWPYNLYSMIHTRDEKELDEVVNIFAEKLSNFRKGHRVLRSLREFKKTSMKYFE